MSELKLCHTCRLLKGYEPKGNGCHTAMLGLCDNCKNELAILPERHWVKKEDK